MSSPGSLRCICGDGPHVYLWPGELLRARDLWVWTWRFPSRFGQAPHTEHVHDGTPAGFPDLLLLLSFSSQWISVLVFTWLRPKAPRHLQLFPCTPQSYPPKLRTLPLLGCIGVYLCVRVCAIQRVHLNILMFKHKICIEYVFIGKLLPGMLSHNHYLCRDGVVSPPNPSCAPCLPAKNKPDCRSVSC